MTFFLDGARIKNAPVAFDRMYAANLQKKAAIKSIGIFAADINYVSSSIFYTKENFHDTENQTLH